MTDSKKLELILEKIDGIDKKVDNLDEKVSALDKKVNVLDEKVNVLDERANVFDEKINVLDERVGSLDERVNSLDERMSNVESDLQEVKRQTIRTNLLLENEIRVNICRVAEGHLDLSRNLHEALKIDNEKEMLSIRVGVLESEVRGIKDRIEHIA